MDLTKKDKRNVFTSATLKAAVNVVTKLNKKISKTGGKLLNPSILVMLGEEDRDVSKKKKKQGGERDKLVVTEKQRDVLRSMTGKKQLKDNKQKRFKQISVKDEDVHKLLVERIKPAPQYSEDHEMIWKEDEKRDISAMQEGENRRRAKLKKAQVRFRAQNRIRITQIKRGALNSKDLVEEQNTLLERGMIFEKNKLISSDDWSAKKKSKKEIKPVKYTKEEVHAFREAKRQARHAKLKRRNHVRAQKRLNEEVKTEALIEEDVSIVEASVWEELMAYAERIFEQLGEGESYLHIVSSFATFAAQMYRADKVTDKVLAIIALGNSFRVADKLTEVIGHIRDVITFEPECVVTESFVMDGIATVDMIMNTPLVTSLMSLLTAVISIGYAKGYGKVTIKEWFGKPKPMTMLALAGILVNVLVNVAYYKQYLETNDVGSYWFAADPDSELCSRHIRLMKEVEFLDYAGGTEGRVPVDDWMNRANTLITNLDDYSKRVRVNLREKYATMRSTLDAKRQDVRAHCNSFVRVPPVGLFIVGPPGIGKSYIKMYTHKIFCDATDRKYSSTLVYTHVMDQAYFDGYDPIGTPIMDFPEIGAKSDNAVKRDGDPALTTILNVISPDRFVMNVAACPQKGGLVCKAEFVTMDGNNEELSLKNILKTETAFKRRVLVIAPTLKGAFKQDDSHMVDSFKVARAYDDGMHPLDIYTWKVSITKPNGDAVVQKHEIFTNVREFSTWLYDYIRNHRATHSCVMRMDADPVYREGVDFDRVENIENDDVKSIDEHPIRFEKWIARGSFVDDLKEDSVHVVYKDTTDDSVSTEAFGVWDCQSLLPSGNNHELPRVEIDVGDEVKMMDINYVDDAIVIPPPEPRFGKIKAWCKEMYYEMVQRFCGIVMFILVLFSNNSMAHKALYYIIPALVYCGMVPGSIVILLTMLMRWTRFKEYLMNLRTKYIHERMLRPISNKTAIGIVVGLTSIALFIKLLSTHRKRKRVATESHSKLSEYEKDFECGEGYSRVKMAKATAQWNPVRKISKESPYKGDAYSLETTRAPSNRTITVKVDSKSITTMMFGIRGNYWMMNSHAVLNKDEFIIIDNSTGVDYHIKKGHTIFLDNDICLVQIPTLRTKDNVKHFISEGEIGHSLSGYVGGEKVMFKPCYGVKAKNDVLGDIVIGEAWEYQWASHSVGSCGTILCAELGKSSAIIGIHSAGAASNAKSFGSVVTREMLEKSLKTCKNYLDTYSECFIRIEETLDPVEKSLFRYEHLPYIQYLGRLEGPIMMPKKSGLCTYEKSKEFQKDVLCGVLGLEQTVEYSWPLMRAKITKDGEYISPYNIGMRKMNTPPITLDNELMERTIKVITTHLISGIGDVTLRPLSAHCAINGVRDDPFISRINASTSGGYGYGKKEPHIPLSINDMDRFMTDSLADTIVDFIETYMRGDSCGPLFHSHLKDEPREKAKCVAGKTRLFYMTPLDFLILCRMFLSPVYSLTVEHNDVFCNRIGTNPYQDGNTLHDIMTSPITDEDEKDDEIMEGDFGGFDVSMPYQIGAAANQIVYNLCEHYGYNDAALRVVKGIQSDMLFPVVVMLQDAFIKPGLQPSGKYATAEDNSLRNMVMSVYYYIATTGEEDYFENVRAFTYGDDFGAKVSIKRKDEINNITYQAFVREVYGMEYTTADKKQEMEKFVKVKDSVFLKRHLVWSKVAERYVARIDPNTLFKMVRWRLASQSVATVDQHIGMLNSFFYEVFIYCVTLRDDIYESERLYLDCINITCDYLTSVYGIFDYRGSLPLFRTIYERVFHDLDNADSWTPTDFFDEHKESVRLESGIVNFSAFSTDKKVELMRTESLCLVSATKLCRHAEMKEYNFDGICYLDGGSMRFEETDALDIAVRRDFYAKQAISLQMLLDRGAFGKSPYSLIQLKRSKYLYSKDFPELRTWQQASTRLRELKLTVEMIDNMLARKDYDIFTESAIGEQNMNFHGVDEKDNENFGEYMGDEAIQASSGVAMVDQQGQRSLLNMDAFLSRPIEIATVSIPVNTDVDLEYQLWDLFTLNPAVRAKLRNFAYLRGDLVVRIAVSGTPFHQGRLLVSYQPYPTQNDTLINHKAAVAIDAAWRPLFLNYLSQAPGATTIDVKSNKTMEMHIPFVSPNRMGALFQGSVAISDVTSFNDFENMGSLFIKSINRVQSVSASPSAVYLQVYCYMENAEFGTSTGTQLVVLTESDMKDERETGPVEKLCSGVSAVSKALQNVPVIAPFAKASSMVADGVGMLAAHYGWSKPVIIDEAMIMKNEPFQNAAVCIGTDTTKRIVYDPKQEVSVDVKHAGIDDDELTIAGLCARPSYLTTFTWNETDGVMANSLFRCKVTPQLSTIMTRALQTYAQPTAMAFATAPFYWWRGNITFRVQIVASAYHRGKIAIYYEPSVSQDPLVDADIDTNKQYIMIVDIQKTQDFEFCVNWNRKIPWVMVPSSALAADAYDTISFTSTVRDNGIIGIVPFTKLQSPDNTVPVEINIFVYSEEMHVNQVTEVNMPDDRTIYTESYIESDLKTGESIPCFELNKSTADDGGISELHFGEEPTTFRTLLKRYTTTYVSASLGDPGSNFLYFRAVARIFPAPSPLYGSALASISEINLFGYLRYAFLCLKGGVRKRLRLNTLAHSSSYMNRSVVTLQPPSNVLSLPSNTESWVALAPLATLTGSVHYIPHTNGGIEVELPFYTPNLFIFACNDKGFNSFNAGEFYSNMSCQYKFEVETNSAGSATNYFVEETAGAEDLTLYRFLGAPCYKV
ncbi:hypothetical protein [Beihai picorna-like virus 60]|uniref:hypothetical protein n=1 Tax=Beihai picorna-like virus 60 TaxID=1922606 RepID=UPI0009097017|nr:hypothetical protein [Beihai picorna-like virus 60]APG76685.1 hypothetical protein [Beihai picorna-like virus 60]